MTLTDTQAILLSSAAQRESGSLYPLSSTITAPAGGIARSQASLLKRGLIEECDASTPESVSRIDGVSRYGLFITAAGRSAIGVEEQPEPAAAEIPVPGVTRQTKAALVLTLLERGEGVTLPELVEATGWLPHTTRAALTGLRRKGHTLVKTRREGATCYRIEVAA